MDIFLFVLGYVIQTAATCLLIWKIKKSHSIYGLSVDTQICFLIGCISRCIWTLDTRLVETYFAYTELIASTVCCTVCVYYCWVHYDTTTMHAPQFLRTHSLAGVSLILAFFFHPSEFWFSVQILVAFSIYIECVGLLPQLWLMKKMQRPQRSGVERSGVQRMRF